jgi:hypothetical protein
MRIAGFSSHGTIAILAGFAGATLICVKGPRSGVNRVALVEIR